jgi:hypothetical protein
MSDRTFVVEISDRAMPHSVEHIGQGLLALNGHGLHSGAREIDAVLHDVLQGIHDKILLKSDLAPEELEKLLHKQLGRDFKLCSIRWLEGAG